MFDRVYVVNRYPDRWARFAERWPIDWPFVEPIRFQAIDDNIVKPPGKWVGDWSKSRAHLAIVEQCLCDQVRSVLILNDDIFFDISEINKWLHKVPNNWEVLYFGDVSRETMPREVANNVYNAFGKYDSCAYALSGRGLKNAYDYLITGNICDIGTLYKQYELIAYSPFRPVVKRSPDDPFVEVSNPAFIIPYFNPYNHDHIRANLYSFVESVSKLKIPIFIIEAYVGDATEFNSSIELNSTVIHIQMDDIIPCNERLINLGALLLPPEYDIICWADTSIIWNNADMRCEIVDALRSYKLVQLWKNGSYINRKGQYISNITCRGLAWAMARRDFSKMNGLFQYDISGCADVIMYNAWTGTQNHVHDGMVNAVDEWSDRAYDVVRGSVGEIPISIKCIYDTNKKYVGKYIQELETLGYNPTIHIIHNQHQSLQWSDVVSDQIIEWAKSYVAVTGKGTNFVSIIMLTRNALEYTKKALTSIKETIDCGYELIIIDNASTDGTVEYLNQYSTHAIVIFNSENVGIARGRNQGIHVASGNYIIFLDNDVEVSGNWLQTIIDTFNSNKVGIVGCDGYTIRTLIPCQFDAVPDRLADVDVVPGYCFAFKVELLDNIGDQWDGLTNNLFWHEDLDFCMRAKKAGYRVVVNRDISIVHHEHKSVGCDLKQIYVPQNYFGYVENAIDISRRMVDSNVLYIHNDFNSKVAAYNVVANNLTTRLRNRGMVVIHKCQIITASEPCSFDLCKGVELFHMGKRYVWLHQENDRPPRAWREHAETVDGIFMGSEHLLDACRDEPYYDKIIKLCLSGIDDTVYNPQAARNNILYNRCKPNGQYMFLNVGASQPRKNTHCLIRIFAKTFAGQNDVVLVIKDGGGYGDTEGTIRLINRLTKSGCPKIVHICNDLSPQEMASLYAMADAYVHPHRAECFGLPLLEAISCGVRLVGTTRFGGPRYNLNGLDNVHFFDYNMQPSSFHNNPDERFYESDETPMWAEPHDDDIAQFMRYAYKTRDNKEAQLAVAEKSSLVVRDKFSFDTVSNRLYDYLVNDKLQPRKHNIKYNIDYGPSNGLHNVTLVCINCTNSNAAIRAIDLCCHHLKFGKVILFSDIAPDYLPDYVEFVQVQKLDLDGYNRFVLCELWKYIKTSHVLTIHEDGWVIRPDLWNPEWLKYDYIGAPWPQDQVYSARSLVGNSGFCLRSQKLLYEISKIYDENTVVAAYGRIIDDVILCFHYYDELIQKGYIWASESEAWKFSFETPADDYKFGDSFGYHGTLHVGYKWFNGEDVDWRPPFLDDKVRLYMSYYNPNDAWRAHELDTVLRKNLSNKYIDEIVVLIDTSTIVPDDILSNHKLRPIKCNRHPHFSDFVTAANEITGDNDVNIIINSDILCDDSLKHVIKISSVDFWAISRHEWGQHGLSLVKIAHSQDVWVWRGKSKLSIDTLDFRIGSCACDCVIAHRAHAAGYHIRNPANSICFEHVHADVELASWQRDWLPSPYVFIKSHDIDEFGAPYVVHLKRRKLVGNPRRDRPLFVLIASRPRSGTHWLRSLLTSMPGVTMLSEPFNSIASSDNYSRSIDPVVWLRTTRPSSSWLHGCVIHGDCASNQVSPEIIEALRRVATHVIILYRENDIERYVSERIAAISGVWSNNHSTEVIHIDRDDFEKRHKEINDSIANDHEIYKGLPIQVITYEQMMTKYEDTIGRLSKFLGLDLTHAVASTAKQETRNMCDVVINYNEIKSLDIK